MTITFHPNAFPVSHLPSYTTFNTVCLLSRLSQSRFSTDRRFTPPHHFNTVCLLSRISQTRFSTDRRFTPPSHTTSTRYVFCLVSHKRGFPQAGVSGLYRIQILLLSRANLGDAERGLQSRTSFGEGGGLTAHYYANVRLDDPPLVTRVGNAFSVGGGRGRISY